MCSFVSNWSNDGWFKPTDLSERLLTWAGPVMESASSRTMILKGGQGLPLQTKHISPREQMIIHCIPNLSNSPQKLGHHYEYSKSLTITCFTFYNHVMIDLFRKISGHELIYGKTKMKIMWQIILRLTLVIPNILLTAWDSLWELSFLAYSKYFS